MGTACDGMPPACLPRADARPRIAGKAAREIKSEELPEFPVPFPDDPDAEQEVCDGMSGHRISEPVFAQDQRLKDGGTKKSRQPLVMRKPEEQRSHNQGEPVNVIQGQIFKIQTHEIPVQEGTIKRFLDGRHNESGAHGANAEKKPGHSRTMTKLFKRIPGVSSFEEEFHFGIIWVQENPNRADSNARDHGFPTDGPTNFRDKRPHFPDAPDPEEHLE